MVPPVEILDLVTVSLRWWRRTNAVRFPAFVSGSPGGLLPRHCPVPVDSTRLPVNSETDVLADQRHDFFLSQSRRSSPSRAGLSSVSMNSHVSDNVSRFCEFFRARPTRAKCICIEIHSSRGEEQALPPTKRNYKAAALSSSDAIDMLTKIDAN